jgi:Ran GTPase-activating protein (RanGAP) involved in mRNA processing and transport
MHPTLQVLNLQGNNIGPVGCEKLCAVLSADSAPLQELVLAHNPLGEVGGMTVAEMLMKNSTIRSDRVLRERELRGMSDDRREHRCEHANDFKQFENGQSLAAK